ncbi:MAG: hypothetical protein AAFV86_21045, partial [Pseudomonadota bacterium]
MKRSTSGGEPVTAILREHGVGAGGRRRRRARLVRKRKRTDRVRREERLVLRRRQGRRKATGTGGPIPAAATPSARRSLDVMHDQRVSGRRLCFLSVADDV